ncbi:MAG: hypothetical protein F6K19_34420 [Cyanothece sp. SIO1E1]|nr:hypothetical protein [Cyanothece sp. SIO1E1]
MKFISDTLYGVAGEYEGVGGNNGQVIRINTTTGQGTLVTTTDPLGCWAGMAIAPPVMAKPAPQPVEPFGKIPQPPAPTPPPKGPAPQPDSPAPKVPVTIGQDDSFFNQLTFEQFGRNPATDVVCVAPVRTIVRREEEIILIRRIRKVEEIDASPTCPVNTTQVSARE